MNWRDRVAALLGAASPLGWASEGHALPAPLDPSLDVPQPAIARDTWTYLDPADRQRLLFFAGHRSHSSHSSHRSHYSGSGGHSSHSSHSSHYSGSGGGGYVTPALPRPTPAPSSAPTTRPFSSDGLTSSERQAAARPTSSELEQFIRKVQVALIMRGYDPGPVDGKMGAKLKEALMSFQAAHSLANTGLMDVATLRQLGVLK